MRSVFALFLLASLTLPAAVTLAATGGFSPGGQVMVGGLLGGGPGMHAPMRGDGPGGWTIHPARLPVLKGRLAITPRQEPQWNAYASAVTAAWDSRRESYRQVGGESYFAIEHARAALVAVLDPNQQDRLNRAAPSNGCCRG